MRVDKIMSTHVRTVGVADSAELAWERMRLHRIHHLVVVHDGDILGVITDRDLGYTKMGDAIDLSLFE